MLFLEKKNPLGLVRQLGNDSPADFVLDLEWIELVDSLKPFVRLNPFENKLACQNNVFVCSSRIETFQ
jgi:hypothetical protein